MIDCKKMAQERKDKLKAYIQENNWTGSLAVIQVGNDPASDAYIRGKRKDCEEVGIDFYYNWYPEDADEYAIRKDIYRMNDDDSIKGIIVQLPLPDHMSARMIISSISWKKDVDGFTNDSPFTPCTPKAVMTILEELGVDVDGKVCCVIGRGMVGKPMVDILTKKNATVVWCNSHTTKSELRYALLTSDIVISAAGVPNLIEDARGRYGQVVIDVGITRGEDGKLYGDVNKCLYSDYAKITPVPGGVGLMTRVALLENVVYGGNNK